ncbi:PREDICTED: F-box/kelch-repeat protein At2g24250-like [Camelina sativa]|uniref:F-box/kelch-repeat protein At2g24250-like n=1 Tax=Camelina sativa TaxID=90675 RepID=A0ABM0TPN5_CAMSA|nr:PREDICTED: F-box/kelch-repeat protein At2g24250-like [Camelina sativa]
MSSSSTSSIMPDWSQLPEELLPLISKHLEENCFDVIHARSVCSLWRSIFPFPSSLLRPSYSLPEYSLHRDLKEMITLEKVPLFLFRVLTPCVADDVSTSEYYLGGIGRHESEEDHMELPSPLQCSVKVKIPGTVPTLMNMIDCQIIPLGHEYRMMGRPLSCVAFLPLDKERGGGAFVVLVTYRLCLLVLTSAEMRWKRLSNIRGASSWDVVTFRGRFYASRSSCTTFVIDPYSLEVTLLSPVHLRVPHEIYYLVPCGDDELFLVEGTYPAVDGLDLDISQLTFRVRRLDEEACTWVEVNNLGDRVLFIGGRSRKFSISAKELPHGCGLTGNSILFTHLRGNVTFAFKYGVHAGNAVDNLNCWRSSRENRVMILKKFAPVVAFQVER